MSELLAEGRHNWLLALLWAAGGGILAFNTITLHHEMLAWEFWIHVAGITAALLGASTIAFGLLPGEKS